MSDCSVNILEAKFNLVCPVSSLSFCCLIKIILVVVCLNLVVCFLLGQWMRNPISLRTPAAVDFVNSNGPFSHWLELSAVLLGLCKQVHLYGGAPRNLAPVC